MRTRIAAVTAAVITACFLSVSSITASASPVSGEAPRPPQDAATGPLIALTFDDGPSILTPEVLKILKKHRVKATFFMQGEHVAENPDLARRVVQEGHVVGNHSYTHPRFTQITDEQADQEITQTNATIAEATGVTPTLFRYPFGEESDAGNAVIRREQMWGGVLWHWETTDPGDFECPGKKGVQQYITGNAVDQALILLHDGNDVLGCGKKQVKELDKAITQLKKQGFRFGVVAPADGPSSVNQQSWVQVVPPLAERKGND